MNWLVDAADISFSDTGDLAYSLGKAKLDQIRVKVRVRRVDLGNVEDYVATSYVISGAVTDLYDFAYDGGSAVKQAAELEAGFGTLGQRGHVFRVRVELNHVVNHQHRFGDVI